MPLPLSPFFSLFFCRPCPVLVQLSPAPPLAARSLAHNVLVRDSIITTLSGIPQIARFSCGCYPVWNVPVPASSEHGYILVGQSLLGPIAPDVRTRPDAWGAHAFDRYQHFVKTRLAPLLFYSPSISPIPPLWARTLDSPPHPPPTRPPRSGSKRARCRPRTMTTRQRRAGRFGRSFRKIRFGRSKPRARTRR